MRRGKPNVEGLGLEQAHVNYDPGKGVVVNDRLRTSNHRVYAVGDVCSKLKFTHLSDAHVPLPSRTPFSSAVPRPAR